MQNKRSDTKSGKVEICSQEDGEFTLLVDGHLDVWIAEDDWECTCTSTVSPCQHVMMSVLAIKRGSAMQRAKTVTEGHIRHKVLESSTGIVLKRVWVQQSEEYPFTGQGSLSSFDESIERLFSYELQHTIDVSKERLHDLLIYLSKDADADITFNNRALQSI